jgi:acyl-CoA dehydrogenase-like protein
LTPAVKYWVCKSAPGFLYEAMECLGGNGYVEEGILARHFRESPVNAIWEGSGNVMCLDVLRALSREGEAASQVLQGLMQDTMGLTGAAETASFCDQDTAAARRRAGGTAGGGSAGDAGRCRGAQRRSSRTCRAVCPAPSRSGARHPVRRGGSFARAVPRPARSSAALMPR